MAGTARPDPDPDGALTTLLADRFGRCGDLRALPGERDRNVLVTGRDGDYLLKVMHAGCPADLIDLQCRALDHVAAAAPHLPLPRVVRTRNGASTAVLAGADGHRLAWLATFVPGRLLAEVSYRPPILLRAVGSALATLDRALLDFCHPAMHRDLPWDLRRAGWIGGALDAITDPARRQRLVAVLARYEADWGPRLERLRRTVVHGDGNDHNLLVGASSEGSAPSIGVIDFGDLHHTALVAECAIAAAYAAMGSDDAVASIAELVAGYDAVLPLDDDELALVVPLVQVRLAVSLVTAATQQRLRPDDPYAAISTAGAAQLLEQLHDVDPRLATARLRSRCGREPWPRGRTVVEWLRSGPAPAPVLGIDAVLTAVPLLDLSFASRLAGDDPEQFDPALCAARIAACLHERGSQVGIGRYGEARPFYLGTAFGGAAANARRRTVHLGIDLFAPAGTPVCAPLAGEIAFTDVCTDRLDYGGLVVLRHHTQDGTPFGTLYGHLEPTGVRALRRGQRLAAGQPFAALGAPPDNGDWPPHLHLQLCADDPANGPDVPPGVAEPDAFAAHAALYPNPSPLLGLRDDQTAAAEPLPAMLLARRQRHFAANLATSYREPLQLVRGRGHFVYDARGRRYLDAYNNVPHVGHGHPRVAAAIADQTHVLATNTRYLHELPLVYAERLAALLPATLSMCFLVNSGSEANELAVRLCRAFTGRRDMLVMAHGYHGNTTGAMDLSPYKWPAGGGPDWVHTTVQPDVYRGCHRGAAAGPQYVAQFARELAAVQARGRSIAGYLCECLPSVGGQLVLPDGFLAGAYAAVRAAGGLCIADDVQTALGRTGDHKFGFEQQAVVPDVLVLGKPLGNGYPLAAVVTTPAIAAAFARGPEFFSTFGGNTVAGAAGLAVLDVLADEGLQANARRIGAHLRDGLRALGRQHAVVGDVRGLGLFLGVELVTDRDQRTPATLQAHYVTERLRQRRILIGTDGPHDNVLKIRPPMTFDASAADLLLGELALILREDGARAGDAPSAPPPR